MTDSNSVPPLSGQLEFYMRPDCPFCDQVWTALAFKKLHYSKTDWTGVTEKPAWFKIASPQGTVPILRLLDGTYMDDSEDMLAWIDRQDTNEGSYGVTDEQDLKWLAVARKQLYPAMFRVLIPPSPAVQQEFTEKLIKVIETLTEHLKVR